MLVQCACPCAAHVLEASWTRWTDANYRKRTRFCIELKIALQALEASVQESSEQK